MFILGVNDKSFEVFNTDHIISWGLSPAQKEHPFFVHRRFYHTSANYLYFKDLRFCRNEEVLAEQIQNFWKTQLQQDQLKDIAYGRLPDTASSKQGN